MYTLKCTERGARTNQNILGVQGIKSWELLTNAILMLVFMTWTKKY